MTRRLPHSLRSLGLAPVVAALVGLGITEMAALGGRWLPGHRGPWGGGGIAASALVVTLVIGVGNYYARSPRQWWDAEQGSLVQLAAAARPGDAVAVDDYRFLDLEFLDWDQVPHRVQPGHRLTTPAPTTVYALSPDELERTVGAGAGARAEVVGRDPAGVPEVWRVRP